MSALSEYWNLGLGGLFLNEETYHKMKSETNPFVKGLILILIVAVVVAVTALIGKVLEWSTTPDLSNLKNIILQEMQTMSWYKQTMRDPQGARTFQQIWESVWMGISPMMGVNLISAGLGIITNPLGLAIRWLVYGIVVFAFARMLGGKGTLGQTLGCTALAVMPQVLGVFQLLPYVQLGGIEIWGLACSYVGIKVAQELSPWRAFWVTILPFVLLLVLGILFGCLGGFIASNLMAPGGRP